MPKLHQTAPIARLDTAADGGTETPALRLFSLLEVLSRRDQALSLQELVDETGWPKPSVHRLLQQLEASALLVRTDDGRRYATATRLRRFAENLLLNDTLHGARRQVLRQLVEEIGETCNLTALAGGEVVYLDRVETHAPLRFYLQPGSRVPVHCSASGKLLLSQLAPAQWQRLLGATKLEKYTANTRITLAQLERDLLDAKSKGHAFDDEEFLPGLFCIAVLVPVTQGVSNLAVAVQAPLVRMDAKKAKRYLPALNRAAQRLATIEGVRC
jgi:IclR family transcriptional regulator, acetate operon repressor